jgi:hypothetical protein
MITGKLVLTGLLALILAIGASSTASARPGYSFGTSASAWGGLHGQNYYYHNAPGVINPYLYRSISFYGW